MPVLKADHNACKCYASRVHATPAVYDIDRLAFALPEYRMTDKDRQRIEEIVRGCPMSASSIEDK